MSEGFSSESRFETELIDHLCQIGSTKQWRYEPSLKTTDDLWGNFARILYSLNQDKLNCPLSVTEFDQVKQEISSLTTPYQAGQFLYGLNGISQVEVDTDDGRHVFLTVFDQRQVGGGNTQYQIVNQVKRPAKITGKQERRFDVTLLINGLPIIQIEEKRDSNDVDEALNQMRQYIAENQYSDIFSTVQILVALSPVDVRYMANTTAALFNKAFAFKWQTERNERVSDWHQFANLFLSIPMAHKMSTSYMILDGTKNKQQLKVMRPYQVYATRRVLDAIEKHDFDFSTKENAKLGYIWHTTGSGKTITSFKTAWLASRLPNVDKVVFLVDRIALTDQTIDNYAAYDPDNDSNQDELNGVVQETKHTRDLAHRLKSNDGGIIVTSTQKLARLVFSNGFKDPGKNLVFIVDEAHRSTAGDTFVRIQKAFTHAVWVGYTGTPIFDDADTKVQKAGLKTHDIFGDLLHSYTIKNAIADKNVLGFRVDFKNTIPMDFLEAEYLPNYFQVHHPDWTQEQVDAKIAGLSAQEIDDLTAPIYDMNPQHVEEVVSEVFREWQNRSAGGKYNALLTTHVGGGAASTPMAMMYWWEFQRQNAYRLEDGLSTLRVAVTFSQDTSNSDSQLETNQNLAEAIAVYNAEFGTNFGMDNTAGYTADVISRLSRSAADGQYLDLVIVVDQLLTGFDAPELNTLYVDRTLKSAGLIQAYSRTNRIFDRDKPFGNIINFRLPTLNEKFMNEALSIYANEDSAVVQDALGLVDSGVLAKPFSEQLDETRQIVEQIKDLTGGFVDIPKSEAEQQKLLQLLGSYNSGVDKLKQYPVTQNADGTVEGFDYSDPTALTMALGMTQPEERKLTTVFANELKRSLARSKRVDFDQIDLKMTHIKEVEVNYDYLTELIATLMNAAHDHEEARRVGDDQAAATTQATMDKTSEQITLEVAASQNVHFIDKVARAVEVIVKGKYKFDDGDYPVDATQTKHVIEAASQVSVDRELLDFRNAWGITDVMTAADLKSWLRTHAKGVDDLDAAGLLTRLRKEGAAAYRQMATDDQVRALTLIRYRNELRDAVRTLADSLVGKL
ncbi:MAG: HsdR family type I site-specific deoxyribonuclease [Propionibacteriaceae bacterium]|jgi:type I restriction enzyme R subunit|nr:HsdR family type I site-specific deoxyribonuclease [Propionibacteriaceae bacterium]